ncbi:DPP IV N-terminal domain-containing protein [Flavobacterium amniphilum]|uniref:TolB family protein n=1 Tax=Flavobacterium amniphilum TaxID=1834035 RepID=UPI00202A1E62|nr:DUF5050 domain-containing protein [Flavobacterium amniphilum]MCL9805506.1 DPP IV N-terminal domain-containing protein [Flavobacterium amniphilum]
MKYLPTFILLVSLTVSCNVAHKKITDKNKGKIMFTSKRDGNFDVYLMNDDSTNVVNLTNDPSTDYGLNWSPDGKHILFYSNRSGNEEIWRMNPDGSNPVNLTNAPSNERSATYSPDGKKIVFISDRDEKTNDLYLMNADGSDVKRITTNKSYCESPVWTKDGQNIVFTLEIKEVFKDVKKDNKVKKNKKGKKDKKVAKEKDEVVLNGELFMVNINGNNLRRMTYKSGFDSGAAISPNGKKIAFYSKSEAGFMDIYIMTINGTEIHNLTNDQAEDYSPSWSPDGNWISFTSGNSTNYDIWKINIHTKERIRLTSNPKRDETPYFKP